VAFVLSDVLMRIWAVDGGLPERADANLGRRWWTSGAWLLCEGVVNDDDMPKPYFIPGDGRGSSGSPSALEVTDGDEI
jgi:hypothetical protein